MTEDEMTATDESALDLDAALRAADRFDALKGCFLKHPDLAVRAMTNIIARRLVAHVRALVAEVRRLRASPHSVTTETLPTNPPCVVFRARD